ncbi:MAG: nucleoid-associated protein [Lysinibacillus sp.]|nr:nucleoid-associated protein [Lysinibacillus sp.]
MLDVTESILKKYVVHHVSDILLLSDEVYPQPETLLEAAFVELAFHKVNWEEEYEFFHETNLELNEVYTYIKSIFDQEESFLEQSRHITTHLHSASQHPNIKPGELFIGLFENCLFGAEARRVLSIVKIDEREIFLDVKSEESRVSVNGIDGINVKKANNVAIIIDMGTEEAPLVFIKTKKKEDVVYWQERFLKIRATDENYQKTNLALTEVRKMILKEENFTNTEKIHYLNKTLDYFRNEEQFDASDYIDKVFDKAEPVQKEVIAGTVKPYETIISESALLKAEKSYKRKIKLDSNIEIQVNVQNIDEINDLIEVGYDEATNRKYYKIYFHEES